MTDKERLNCTLVSFGRSNGKILFSDDIDWLNQQAERVEELKNRCTEIAAESTVREEKLLKENQRLEKRVEELEEELNGAEHRYGYKQMYKICNRDYATLNSEKNRYKQALEYAQSELEYAYVTGNMELRGESIKKALKAIDEALEGESQ